jgi:hypothetical protein
MKKSAVAGFIGFALGVLACALAIGLVRASPAKSLDLAGSGELAGPTAAPGLESESTEIRSSLVHLAKPGRDSKERGAGSPVVVKRVTLSKKKGVDEAEGAAEDAAPTRAWFPETFLFEPLVITDTKGHAEVPVKVPDRLTSWRVLALAHSRQGGQAGAVASFLGTLPAYVEPVTPAFLYAGDEVRLPIQLVNTTEREMTPPLSLSATGATLAATGGAVRLPAGGEVLQYVTLSTRAPGTATVRASLGASDAVEKSFPVQPAGLRAVVSKGGTLAAPRTFELAGPDHALPGTESLRLRVFPGALGLVRAELASAPGRGGVAEDAYLLALLGQAPSLLRALGQTVDERAFREQRLLVTQRVMRHARAPSLEAATLLTEATLAHPDEPILARTAERLAAQVAQGQRPDGSFEAKTGWTLQRLLVFASECVRAVRLSASTPQARQRIASVSVKASGAFERMANRVDDGYTAAAMLASGVVTGTVAERLKKHVLEHLKTAGDGSKYLEVAEGVVRADGRSPSTYEATALAVLALKGEPVTADLGTWLMSGYSASAGWGDGRANLVALRAALELFKEPVPAGVRISVERDGARLAEGVLDAAALKDVLSIDTEATDSSGPHTWTVKAEPPVPGLGYSLQLVAFTPWKAADKGGPSLTATLPRALQAGRPAEVALSAAMPGNVAMALALPLPAGVQVDTPSLDALVTSGRIIRYESEDGRLLLHVPPQAPGAVYSVAVRVIPTLAGKLQSPPGTVAPEGEPEKAKSGSPLIWLVGRAPGG